MRNFFLFGDVLIEFELDILYYRLRLDLFNDRLLLYLFDNRLHRRFVLKNIEVDCLSLAGIVCAGVSTSVDAVI